MRPSRTQKGIQGMQDNSDTDVSFIIFDKFVYFKLPERQVYAFNFTRASSTQDLDFSGVDRKGFKSNSSISG